MDRIADSAVDVGGVEKGMQGMHSGMHSAAATLPGEGAAVFSHETLMDIVHDPVPLNLRLRRLHALVQERYDFIERIAVVSYEAQTDRLKTFVHSSGGDEPLSFYESRLAASSSLSQIAATRKPRVVQDLGVAYGRRSGEHSLRIRGTGYAASYTMPVINHGTLAGFLFFNSRTPWVFTTPVLDYLNLVGHVLSLMVVNELVCVGTLLSAVRTITHIAQCRDFETGSHLERMAHYSRVIALAVAPQRQRDDAFVEHVFRFAPLHDIGKIAVPDDLLQKPGRLTDEEFKAIQAHTVKGVEIIDTMLDQFGLSGVPHTDMLRNIALHHHETPDGLGYPHGLAGEDIPLEARICAVADVFDALTSKRPYKDAWSNEQAFELLQRQAGPKFDPDCVAALLAQREEVARIQAEFGEDRLG